MPAKSKDKKPDLTLEERRVRRQQRREKQRADNVHRAAKMHKARLAMETERATVPPPTPAGCLYVGCSGWFYWKWRGLFYPDGMPTGEWFNHYAAEFDTVEINASFFGQPSPTSKPGSGRRRAGSSPTP